MDIAVIGSGIAGLFATWNLAQGGHRVTVFEQSRGLGMSLHRAAVPKAMTDAGVDLPLRVSSVSGWPSLSKLCAAIGVEMIPVDLSSSYSELDGRTWFQHAKLVTIGERGLSLPSRPRQLFNGRGLRFVAETMRLRVLASRLRGRSGLSSTTFGAWLGRHRFDPAFVRLMVEPILALACTCSNAALRDYPADILVDFLDRLIDGTQHLRRFRFGTADIARKLAESAHSLRLGQKIRAIEQHGESVAVTVEGGERVDFDHAVIATQANHAAAILGDAESEMRGLLRRIPYEASTLIVHNDKRLMPRDRGSWTAVNFFAALDGGATMSTIWANLIEPSLVDTAPIFQTWNPLFEPDPARIVRRVTFDRPVVSVDSRLALETLLSMEDAPERRIALCGSYFDRGVPLLESGVTSGMRACARLGVIAPWA